MASEKKMNDATTSFQQPDTPVLCANGCGFFGTPSTMNLCSKCYRDHNKVMAAVEKSMSSVPLSLPPTVDVVEEKTVEEATTVVMDAPPMTKPANRCGCCNKKVGVTGFKCRCGITFCGSHRYPEEHGCSFDFRGAGRDAIAKANPQVKADKMDRF